MNGIFQPSLYCWIFFNPNLKVYRSVLWLIKIKVTINYVSQSINLLCIQEVSQSNLYLQNLNLWSYYCMILTYDPSRFWSFPYNDMVEKDEFFNIRQLKRKNLTSSLLMQALISITYIFSRFSMVSIFCYSYSIYCQCLVY